MPEMLLHPVTKKMVDSFIAQPSHALLLQGAHGAGKYYLAEHIACSVLGVDRQKILYHPFFLAIGDTGSISIEDIRALKHFLKLKTTGTGQTIRRVIVIENADNMLHEAQNALLKQLEEPPADTLIILTAHDQTTLLPTVKSRVRTIAIKNVSLEVALQHFANHSQAAVTKAYYMSSGRMGLITSLLDQSEEHPLVGYISQAKDLLQKSNFDRLCMVTTLAAKDYDIRLLLDGLYSVCRAALMQAAVKNETKHVGVWHQRCQEVDRAQRAMTYKPQTKLLLTDLFLAL